MGHLEVEPEPGIGVEIPAEADSGIGRHAAALAHDLGEPVRGDANGHGKGTRAHPERL